MSSHRIRLIGFAILASAVALDARVPQVAIGAQSGGGGGNVEMQVVTASGGGVANGVNVNLPVSATGSAIIVGQVVDAASNQPIPGAIVTLGTTIVPGARIGGGGPVIVNGSLAMTGRGGGAPTIPRVMTDSTGRFAFRSVPQGTPQISAQKNGYLDGAYGRLRPNGGSQPLEVRDGERIDDVTIRMFKPAVIAGFVLDERGDPVVRAEVEAYRREGTGGATRLERAASTTTDDRGQYRLGDLAPGEYIVSAPTVVATAPADFSMQGRVGADLLSTMMRPGGGNVSLSFGGGTAVPGGGPFLLNTAQGTTVAPEMDGRVLSFATTYYPAATSPGEAMPITVVSGEERAGVDVTLRLRPTSTITGQLVGPDGPVGGFALHLVPSDTGDLSTDPDVATAITRPDGTFAFLGVPAGNYVIQTVRIPPGLGRGGGPGVMRVMVFQADTSGGGGPPPPPPPPPDVLREESESAPKVLWTSTPVSVGETGIEGLTVTLNEGLTVKGRVDFDGSADRTNADRMGSIVITAEPADRKTRGGMPPARVGRDGTFTMPGLLPGRYVLRVANPPQNWTLRSIMAGGVDVADAPLEVGSREVGNLVATFTDRISKVDGSVRNAQGQPDDTAAVLVFPTDSRMWSNQSPNPRRMRMARATRTGDFSFAELPAGSYNLIAISAEFVDDWQDPAFLQQLAREATTISLGEGQESQQTLTTRAVRPGGGAPAPLAVVPAAASTPEPGLVFPPLSDGDAWAPAPGRDAAPVAPPSRDARPAPQSRDTRPVQQSRDTRPVQQSRDTRPSPTAASGPDAAPATVSGIVVMDDSSGRPVRRARVAVRSVDQRGERAVMTDDEGRFEIRDLPPGRYSLSASKAAYVSAYFGARRPGRGPGAPLALTAGQAMTGLTLRLGLDAVITGRVLDENGLPFPGVSMRLLQYRQVDGARRLAPASGTGVPTTTQTDDRGEYRFFGLMPGEYVVMASAPARGTSDLRQLSTDDVQSVVADLRTLAAPEPGGGAKPATDTKPLGGRPVGFAPLYYPGTPVAAEASPVRVVAGQEAAGIDVAMRLVPTAKIHGTVVGPDGQPRAGVQLLVMNGESDTTIFAGLPGFVRTGPDGTFTTDSLGPGRYQVTARAGSGPQVISMGGGGMFVSRTEVVEAPTQLRGGPPPPPDAPEPALWAQQDVDLSGQDVEGITLQLREGMTVSGRLVFDGQRLAPPDDMGRVRLRLQPITNGRLALGATAPTVNADGTFTITGVTPGRYTLTATVPLTGFSAESRWTLRSATVGGRETLDTGVVVEPGMDVTGMTATFTDTTAELSGKLLDPAGQPVPDLTVLLFPVSRDLWSSSSRWLRPPTQPDSDGEFRFTQLLPGDYFLAAVTDLDQSDWGDPSFMEQVAAAAIRVTIGDGEKKVQDIRLAGG
ncbi:MAG: carboxypeptidase regulatory-like domain-containing protein [Vicinamibacterales bacterium]